MHNPRPTTKRRYSRQQLAPSSTPSGSLPCAVEALRQCRKIIVVVGAGISTSAGIPDFKSSPGLRDMLDVSRIQHHPNEYKRVMEDLSVKTLQATPTLFHRFLAELGPYRIYSQNIDDLQRRAHESLGKPPLDQSSLVELHGSVTRMVCTLYHWHEFPQQERRLWSPCPLCEAEQQGRERKGLRVRSKGILRPRVSLYNEYAYDDLKITDTMRRDARERVDGLIIAGTTLKIPHLHRFVGILAKRMQRTGGTAIWLSHSKCTVERMSFVLPHSCDVFAQEYFKQSSVDTICT